jgi:hypothetical protein
MTGARRAGRPMARPKAPAAAPHGRVDWSQIDWNRAEKNVGRLQARIVKAGGEGRWSKVRCLQHLLTHSYSGKRLAVKRVTTNRGKRTPGVDGEIHQGIEQRRPGRRPDEVTEQGLTTHARPTYSITPPGIRFHRFRAYCRGGLDGTAGVVTLPLRC